MTATLALAFLLAADPTPADGFTLLFNGKDLSGWQVASTKDKDKAGEPLTGKAETPTRRFTVTDGTIVIDPKVKGDITISTEKTFDGPAHIAFEFKPGKACNNDLYFRGMKFDIKPGSLKPVKVDEWNTLEIIATAATAEVKINGEAVQTYKLKGSTRFGIRAEAGPIAIKNVRVK